MMLKLVTAIGLSLGAGTGAIAQTVIQGDSLYRGLQVGRATRAQVVARLGRDYTSRELTGEALAKMSNGVCVPRKYAAGVELRYPKPGVTCRISYRDQQLGEIVFDSTARVVSAKGIQPGRHRFADVARCYGGLDLNTIRNTLPTMQEVTQREAGEEEGRSFVVLIYPTITFVSPGRRQPGENLSQRVVTQIWLRNE